MSIIRVDGRDYQAPEGKDLLSALIALGINVPYFCWHPALGSVGACRQCAVRVYRDDADQHGRIEMACMTPVREGMRVSVDDRGAIAFRKGVIEWLMVNHPHDCPICDEGGECHLQDMTAMVGHVYRRYRGRKRTYRNQDLGPFINHEMNRCIQCFRCLRFYRDYAGGRDFDVFASKDHTYFGRFEDGKLESEFSGNLIEICPTGVFTDKTLKAHYTRKWDLETAPSVCVHCGLGCNTIPGARHQLLRRIHSRFHPEINRDFICDRGRFGYEFVNHPDRLRQPSLGPRRGGSISWDQAVARFADGIGACRRVIGIGSPRATLEGNFALRALVGEEAFFSGMAGEEHRGMAKAAQVLGDGLAHSSCLAEVEQSDAVLLLGSDPTNEAPMLDYAIRQGMFRAALDTSRRLGIPDWNDYPVREAIQNERGKLFIVAPAAMKLEAIAAEVVRASPPEIITLAWQVAAALRLGADGAAAPQQTAAARIAASLAGARRPLVVASACWGPELVEAALEVTRGLSTGRGEQTPIFLLAPECNSMGAALMGGRSLEEALRELEADAADGLVVVENDLFRRLPARRLHAALAKLRFLVVIDHLRTPTVEQANLALPSATFAEATGTFVNNEGRAQRFFQLFDGPGEAQPAWRMLARLQRRLHPEAEPWRTCEEIIAALAEAIPVLAGATEAAPPSSWRDRVGAKVARESHRSSGRAAKTAEKSVFEPQPPSDPDSPLAFSMEGAQLGLPPPLVPRYWRPGWNSVQARLLTEAESRQNGDSGMGKRLLPLGAGARACPPSPGGRLYDRLAEEELWLVPRPAIFGSDELSRMAPAIASVMPPPAVTIHSEDAARRSLSEGEMVCISLRPGGERYLLPVRLDDSVAQGVAVVPAGYPETAGLVAPAPARMEKAT